MTTAVVAVVVAVAACAALVKALVAAAVAAVAAVAALTAAMTAAVAVAAVVARGSLHEHTMHAVSVCFGGGCEVRVVACALRAEIAPLPGERSS
jgi:hypothetical protein